MKITLAKGERQRDAILTDADWQRYIAECPHPWHDAAIQLADAGCDVFTLARIAGHSSITITQRYVHPQADSIKRASQQTAKAALPAAGK